ncbi:uncharacterized protein LOC123399065 [Hordeum vulgare subsp. vulgare]|uniref:DUF4220 domain-containing protein n=1 Tax=Hordeum vulgare subsp. vulgare TaxID=112509 RepID=A0A8I6YBX0_HORVV|nr:uncharacterized protein LOC123399065 [Hordeum vulgare subsp. vulgare]
MLTLQHSIIGRMVVFFLRVCQHLQLVLMFEFDMCVKQIMGVGNCSDQATTDFSKHIDGQLMRVNALLVASTIVIGVIVGIGAYGQRYRHHPLTSFLFLGATTLFVPILSYVVSTVDSNLGVVTISSDAHIIPGWCSTRSHIYTVFVWASLVQIAGANTTTIVAGDDNKGRNITLPGTVLLVQAIWTSYIVVYYLGGGYYSTRQWSIKHMDLANGLPVLPLFSLLIAKLLLKYYAWYGASRSLAFGRNPHFIVGYMEQLKAKLTSEHSLPPLIVTGEDTTLVQKEPHGYSIKWLFNQADGTGIDNNNLVTTDKVWRLEDDIFPRYSTKQLKDICFSFALFKLLRCRFTRHTIAEFGFIKAHNLLSHVLLQDVDDERPLGMIAHELSFLHDYYYSSLPTSYSSSWLPILSISISLLTMGLSLLYLLLITVVILLYAFMGWPHHGQMQCFLNCHPSFQNEHEDFFYSSSNQIQYGNIFFDLAPVGLLAALVVLSEVREIACYICSNWTKVFLICSYVRHASSWQKSHWKKKMLSLVLRRKCKLLNHWVDKMNQCSVLALHPSTTPVPLLGRLIPLLHRKKVPRAVKAALLKPLRSPNWKNRSNGVASLCTRLQLQADNNPLSTSNGVKGVADTMLVAHIATSILEVRTSEPLRQADSANEIAATHLSRYCAYLVAYVPDLLPDNNEWCKSLYKGIKKKAKRALAASGNTGQASLSPEALVQALSAGSEEAHDLLKNGAELRKKLVELAGNEGEEVAWELLAEFWSEMILYAAPSDNVAAHAEAIARGGELITLLWALLTHLGFISRPEAAMPNTPGDV